MESDLKRLFNPRNMALVGASPNFQLGRFDYIDYFKRAGFTGELYPINPKHQEIKGLKAYPSLKDVPVEQLDLAVFMVTAERVVDLLKETPPGKVKFAVVVTSGFAEVGKPDLEREMIKAARERGIRILGPNCMGLYAREGRVSSMLDQEFGPEPGQIGAVAQSGGHSVNLIRMMRASGLFTRYSVSIGNQADLSMEDMFSWYAADPNVKVISAYVEDLKRPREFMKLAKQITVHKPMLIQKGGTTPRGAQATASHTGALAMPHGIWEGVVRQCGIIPAESIPDIVDMSRALIWSPLPQGPGVAILVPGGGTSVHITDHCIKNGLEVPVLAEPIQAKLSEFIPGVNTMIANPIDLGAAGYNPKAIELAIETVAQDPNIHTFVVYLFIYPFKGLGAREAIPMFIDTMQKAREKISQPLYIMYYDPFRNFPEIDEARREITDQLNAYQIPYFTEMDRCVKTIKRTWEYQCYLKKAAGNGNVL